MPEPSQFRHYQIVQDATGANVEVLRDDDQVAVLAFDLHRQELVHCHVLLEAPGDRAGFDKRCRTLRDEGHPLLARLIEAGEDDGNAFYITSNVDGEPLREYVERQRELPLWLAVRLTCRALDAAVAIAQRGDFLTEHPANSLRVVQTSPSDVIVMAGDYQVARASARRGRGLRPKFERQSGFLKAFVEDQVGSTPDSADQPIPVADFVELLSGCLDSADQGEVGAMQDLRKELAGLISGEAGAELTSAQKPKSIIAPLLATYQEVARAMVNLVRIQSQRLDAGNPYAMRGTLTKTGRTASVEQVPPVGVCGKRVLEIDQLVAKLGGKRGFSSLMNLTLAPDVDGLTCLAEEVVDGISVADMLRRRSALNGSETYLVLAGLDSALSQLEAGQVPIGKLRLEDAFLLNGRPLGDPRQAALMEAKLTEWPSFSVMVRAHPSLASMAGRGTDPAMLLGGAGTGFQGGDAGWQGHWMAAVGRFLLGFESLAGASSKPLATPRERETLERFLGEEMAKGRSGRPSSRGDFLARFARVIQHHDLATPDSIPLSAAQTAPRPSETSIPSGPPRSPGVKIFEPDPAPALSAAITPVSEKSTIGFAELLFQGGDAPIQGSSPIWEASRDGNQAPTLPAELLPLREEVPMWLRAAVFIGGSMVLGAILAHLSGEAIWLKKRAERLSSRAPAPTAQTLAEPEAPRGNPPASPMLPDTGDDKPERPDVEVPVEALIPGNEVPKAVPILQAPKSSLRDSLQADEGR